MVYPIKDGDIPFKMVIFHSSTLPKTNSLPLKIGLLPQKETRKSSNHPFSGAKMLVSGRVDIIFRAILRIHGELLNYFMSLIVVLNCKE